MSLEDEMEAREQALARADVENEAIHLRNAVDLAQLVVQLTNGPIGHALTRRALHDKQQILEGFADIDPTDAKAIAKQQLELARVTDWQSWLVDLVNEGKLAAEELEAIAQSQQE